MNMSFFDYRKQTMTPILQTHLKQKRRKGKVIRAGFVEKFYVISGASANILKHDILI